MSELVSKAIPLAATAAGYYFGGPTGALIGGTIGSGVSSVVAAQQQNRLAANAAAMQQSAITAQTAVQNRQQIANANNAATTDLQTADILRATAAGRRSRGGLAFSGPTTALKTTLGG